MIKKTCLLAMFVVICCNTNLAGMNSVPYEDSLETISSLNGALNRINLQEFSFYDLKVIFKHVQIICKHRSLIKNADEWQFLTAEI